MRGRYSPPLTIWGGEYRHPGPLPYPALNVLWRYFVYMRDDLFNTFHLYIVKYK